MDQSILNSTKKVLNIAPGDTAFDQDILTFINSAMAILHDLGVGPDEGVFVEDQEMKWDDLELNIPMTNLVRTIVFLRARIVFDPPNLSFVLTALENQALEHEVRLSGMREAMEWTDPSPPREAIFDE